MQSSTRGRPAVDVHSRLTEAKAALDGLRAMCASLSEERLAYLTGFQLEMLLNPISQAMEDVLCPTDSLSQTHNSHAGVQ